MAVLARTDPLTGLANRREFGEALYREWHRALRHHSPLSLFVIDVDYFKQYNDTLGHSAGDDCLVRLAELMQGFCKRATDLATRYGGEEFVLLLPDTNLTEATALGQTLLEQVRAAQIAHPGSSVADHITVSIGLTTLVPQQQDCDLVEQADRALYEAKGQGRDRLVVAADAETNQNSS
jgi:diguanylate cyclase (GGDEF)-like protein